MKWNSSFWPRYLALILRVRGSLSEMSEVFTMGKHWPVLLFAVVTVAALSTLLTDSPVARESAGRQGLQSLSED